MTEAIRLVESFELYYRRDYRSLLGLAYVLTGSNTMAEDIVQDALTEAHRRWDTIARYDDPGAWVRRVMVNKSKSRFRKLRSETKALSVFGNRRVELVEPTERVTEVWSAVRSLPPKQAHVVALFYWEDRSLAQIAEILGMAESTVKTHLKRARATLANQLEGFDPDQAAADASQSAPGPDPTAEQSTDAGPPNSGEQDQ